MYLTSQVKMLLSRNICQKHCANYREIYLLSHNFDKNFVKTTFSLSSVDTKVMISRDIFQWEWIFPFPHWTLLQTKNFVKSTRSFLNFNILNSSNIYSIINWFHELLFKWVDFCSFHIVRCLSLLLSHFT